MISLRSVSHVGSVGAVVVALSVGACTLKGRVLAAGGATTPSPASAEETKPPPKAPVVLASNQSYPTCVAADDARVYWANWKGGDIASVAIEGGAVTQLVTGMHPHHLRLDGNNVYFTSSDPGRPVDDTSKSATVVSVPKAGGKPTVLVSGLVDADAIAIDATTVYYGDDATGTVAKVPIAGGTPTVLAQGIPQLGDIDVDATHVYWIGGGDLGVPATISRVDKNGGTPSVVFQGGFLEMGIGADGIYFRSKGELWRCDPDGSNAAKIALSNKFEPRSTARSETSTFVLGRDGHSSSSPFAIYEFPTGAAAVKVVEGLPKTNPGEIAANKSGVYLADAKRGTVTRYPR